MNKNEGRGGSLEPSERGARRPRGARKPSTRASGGRARENVAGVPRGDDEESDRDVGIGSIEEGLVAVSRALETQVRERPYVALAAAVGAGFVLAQALRSTVGRVALVAAGGYAATRLLRGDGMQVLERLMGGDVDEDEELDDERDAPPPITSQTPQ
jgi:hypothetical protein